MRNCSQNAGVKRPLIAGVATRSAAESRDHGAAGGALHVRKATIKPDGPVRRGIRVGVAEPKRFAWKDDLAIRSVLFHIGHRIDPPRRPVHIGVDFHARRGRGEFSVGPFEVVNRQPDLLEVVIALRAAGRLAGRLHRGQEQGHEHANNGDHHEQFHQRKRRAEGF